MDSLGRRDLLWNRGLVGLLAREIASLAVLLFAWTGLRYRASVRPEPVLET